MHNIISVFDAKLPANTTESDLEFPGGTELNFRDVAEIVIPTDVLNQFSSNGMCIRTDEKFHYMTGFLRSILIHTYIQFFDIKIVTLQLMSNLQLQN